MDRLSDIEAFAASTILEDMLDKLKVMKHVLPPLARDESPDKISDDVRSSPYLNTDGLQGVPSGPSVVTSDVDSDYEKEEEASKDLPVLAEEDDDELNEASVGRQLRSLPRDELQKAQLDRTYIEGVLRETLEEICDKRTYQTLRLRIDDALREKRGLERIIEREAEDDEKIVRLTEELNSVRETRAIEVGKRKKRLAFLKNELQELKAKTRMEDSFSMKSTIAEVEWKRKRNAYDEGRLKSDIATIEDDIEEETRSNVEMESFIGLHQAELEQQVELWMDKYENDYDAKMKELTTLKKMMAADKERLEELTILYAEYENIVVTDRIARERERRRIEKERRENEATLRIQSWWRGVIIRKGLRLMKPPKKKKGKKGRRR